MHKAHKADGNLNKTKKLFLTMLLPIMYHCDKSCYQKEQENRQSEITTKQGCVKMQSE